MNGVYCNTKGHSTNSPHIMRKDNLNIFYKPLTPLSRETALHSPVHSVIQYGCIFAILKCYSEHFSVVPNAIM